MLWMGHSLLRGSARQHRSRYRSSHKNVIVECADRSEREAIRRQSAGIVVNRVTTRTTVQRARSALSAMESIITCSAHPNVTCLAWQSARSRLATKQGNAVTADVLHTSRGPVRSSRWMMARCCSRDLSRHCVLMQELILRPAFVHSSLHHNRRWRLGLTVS